MYDQYKQISYPGLYPYTVDLLGLQGMCPQQLRYMPRELCLVNSPLRLSWEKWNSALASHPDHQFAGYVLHGIQDGFRIGFNRKQPLEGARRNNPSTGEHPEVVEQYLSKEITAGRIIGPFPEAHIPGLQVSRMSVIPKGHTPGKWRLITDLSFPAGRSVNDGIDPNLCSLQYTCVEKVARAAQSMGRGALLAKLDVQAAYRLIPVHPDDCPLLGIRWGDSYYVDEMLPFGLRSAPKIFTAVADALQWCFQQRGVTDVDHDYVTSVSPKGG